MSIHQQINSIISKQYFPSFHELDSLIIQSFDTLDSTLIRSILEHAILSFPSIDYFYLKSLNYEQSQNSTQRIEALFSKSLISVNSIPLWTFYISYVKYSHSPPQISPDDSLSGRNTIIQAYEYSLLSIGNDRDSGSLWLDYIHFLKHTPQNSLNLFQEQQNMDSLRKLYQRAIKIPLVNVEHIWKDYDSWENSLNKTTAKKFISDCSGAYMTARAATREMRNLLEPIYGDKGLEDRARVSDFIFTKNHTSNRNNSQKKHSSTPYIGHIPSIPTWSDKEAKMISAWKRYIMWEKCNPLSLPTTESNLLDQRIIYAYKCSTNMMRFHPELWHDAISYFLEKGNHEYALQILQNSIEANPLSLLLHFSLVEFKESRKDDAQEIFNIFESLIQRLEENYIKVNAEFDIERESLINALTAAANPDMQTEDKDAWDGEKREQEREAQKHREKEVDSKVEVKRKRELKKIKSCITLAWIVFMKTARRCQNIKTARSVFGKARKSPYCTYHIYVASALMEFYCNKDPVIASKVFEVGMRNVDLSVTEDANEYVSHYLDFLLLMNDDNNTRALFERAIAGLPASKSREIWTKWIDYENQYGDIGNTIRVLKRKKEAYPADEATIKNTESLARQYQYFNINVIGECDLGLCHASVSSRRTVLPAVTQMLKPIDDKVRRLVSLEAYYPDKFPRPDFSKYSNFKPEADGDLVTGVNTQDNSIENVEMQFQFEVPEVIKRFLKLLPLVRDYNGPILPSEDIYTLLVQLPIQLPMMPVSAPVSLPVNMPVAGHGIVGNAYNSSVNMDISLDETKKKTVTDPRKRKNISE